MSLVVAGIHTGIGKTMASAVLVKALKYNYWKPVQAGELEFTDSDFIRQNAHHDKLTAFNEAYAFHTPASPHYAAEIENKHVELSQLNLPLSENGIVVETAGGIMSPLNHSSTNLDLMVRLNLPTVLVISDYLGSINHSLMSIEVMKQKGINLIGLIFNGESVVSSRQYIKAYSNLPVWMEIPKISIITAGEVEKIAEENRATLMTFIDGK